MSRMLPALRQARDRGTALIEFAIVVPLLLALLFGVLDYGLWFNTSMQVRQETASSVRTAALLGRYAAPCGGVRDMAAVACGTREGLKSSAGAQDRDIFVKVFTTGGSWARGNQVVVCAMVLDRGRTGFVPLPAGGMIKSRSTMAVERISPSPDTSGVEDADPTGEAWSWCTG